MDETITFLLRAMEENQIHARQAEDKRAVLANIILVLACAAVIAFAFIGLNRRALPLAVLLVVLALYGIIVTLKLYERSRYHILRARSLRARLDELCPDAHVEQLQKLAENEHLKSYPRLVNVRLNTIWLYFYLTLGILGAVLAIACLA
jgi:hypothetical protein